MEPNNKPRVMRNAERQVEKHWIAPTSIEDAEERRIAAAERVSMIQGQLGDKNRTIDGERVSDRDYWAWRQKAVFALHSAQGELRQLKHWIKTANISARAVVGSAAAHVDPSDLLSCTVALYRLLKHLATEVSLDPGEQAILDAAWEGIRNETARRS